MTESSQKLANQIVKSWKGNLSNYIIIAPPMSSPNTLFKLLSAPDFISSVLGEFASKISIAKLAGTHFGSEKRFVAALSKQWGVDIKDELDSIEQLSHLTREVINKKHIPVILIEHFNEAIERLGEDFGTALRDLDNSFALKTVVEMPISLKVLKLRWDANPGKSPFLNSDWGQGHNEIFLRGYTVDEVTNLVKKHGGTPEKADFLYAATAGLPELVDRLVDKVGTMDKSYEDWVNSQASVLCPRLIKWLDAPGSYIYARLAAQSLSTSNPSDGATRLLDHPWHSMLLGADGKSGCRLLSLASLHHLADSNESKFITSIKEAARAGNSKDILLQITSIVSAANLNKETWSALELICKFHEAANPYSADNWDQAEKCLSRLEKLADRASINEIKLSVLKLKQWHQITRLMTDLKKESLAGRASIEQFVCVKPDEQKTSAFFLLLNLRLKCASKLEPYHALKAVIEQPESLLQVYCHFKLGICWWSFAGMQDNEASRISITLKKPFTPPRKGNKLSFFEMLGIIFWRGSEMPIADRLIQDEKDFLRFEALYKNRCEQVHSTAFVSASDSDWSEYLNFCQDLLLRVSNSLVSEASLLDLTDPMECFIELADSMSREKSSERSDTHRH